jgi:hypothetical protein
MPQPAIKVPPSPIIDAGGVRESSRPAGLERILTKEASPCEADCVVVVSTSHGTTVSYLFEEDLGTLMVDSFPAANEFVKLVSAAAASGFFGFDSTPAGLCSQAALEGFAGTLALLLCR